MLNEFEIFHEENLNSESFPNKFSINFHGFGKKIAKNFALVEKNDSHPIGSNKVFTMNENGIESIEVDYYQVNFVFFLSKIVEINICLKKMILRNMSCIKK